MLRSPEDIRVVSQPSWFNGEVAANIVSGLMFSILAVIVWVFILRRRIRKQTVIITEKLKNEMAFEERYRNIFERNLTGLYDAPLERQDSGLQRRLRPHSRIQRAPRIAG